MGSTMNFQTFGIAVILVILGEFIQTRNAYKSIWPCNHRRQRFRGHKPRFHQFPRPSRYRQHFNRGPPKIHYPRANSLRHESRYPMNNVDDDEAYTIEIKLPKQKRGYSRIRDHRHRSYDAERYFHGTSDVYGEEEDEDFEERVLEAGTKKIRIKVLRDTESRLRIKVSRNDDL